LSTPCSNGPRRASLSRWRRDTVNEIAAEIGASAAAVALAWVRGRPGITSTLIGARRMDQLEANLTALDLTLSPELEARLTEVSAPKLNFPVPQGR
jgi:aryl-alcohol dehydrogenase-like predicted oxidoreductase